MRRKRPRVPVREFNCLLVYRTQAGHRRQTWIRTRATNADLALDKAEQFLRLDKRRSVARITYGEARSYD